MNHLHLEYRPIEALIPYARNARTHTEAQVAQIVASIREFGWTNPILVDGQSGVIAGHGRLLAARVLALPQVPCIELSHLTDAQRRAYILADNRLALNAGWDEELLALELAELQALEVNLELLGFANCEIDTLLASLQDQSGLLPDADPDEVPDLPAEPITTPGEMIILGHHRLLCGDATRPEDLARLMAGARADMVWTDPPYNVAYEGKTVEALTIQNDSMDNASFRAFLLAFYRAALSVTKPGGPIYVAHADSEGVNFRATMLEAGWLLKQCLIWVKQAFVLGRQDYHWQHEPILYGWAPGAAHVWEGDRSQSTILTFDRPQRSTEHPTMKPVDLVAYCLENSSRPGDVILDPFAGSGTTLIAAEKAGRIARLVELDPRYCDVIVARWEQMTGKQAKRQQPAC